MHPDKTISKQTVFGRHADASHLGKRYFRNDLSKAAGLTVDEIHALILAGLFPAAACHPMFGPSWSRAEVDAWADQVTDEVSGGIGLAACLEMVLGYRRSAWSRTDD